MLRTTLALCLTLALALPARAGLIPQSVTSPGGITAWLVQEPAIPFVALELRFRGGTSLDDAGALGAVNLMTGLLEEGAGDLDARAFDEARDDLAASFRFSASQDAISISARFLSDTSDAAIDLLRLALTQPRFDDAAVARVRAQVLAGLRSDARDPGTQAGLAFDAAAFGDHPYARPSEGTLDSVAALTAEDLRAAHRAALARDRVVVAVTGDIDAAALGLLLDRLLGDLPAVGAPLPGPLQAAAAAVWAEESHVEANRALYQEKYEIADRILSGVQGYQPPEAGFFLWLPVDDGEATALKLWRETGVRVLPGAYLAQGEGNENPGKGFIRVAMVAPKDSMQRALSTLRDCVYG